MNDTSPKGSELVAFLRASPLAVDGEEIAQAAEAARDCGSGRSAEFDPQP